MNRLGHSMEALEEMVEDQQRCIEELELKLAKAVGWKPRADGTVLVSRAEKLLILSVEEKRECIARLKEALDGLLMKSPFIDGRCSYCQCMQDEHAGLNSRSHLPYCAWVQAWVVRRGRDATCSCPAGQEIPLKEEP